MNETIRTILERRAIRRYDTKPIPRETLETILQCAQYAPSGMNSQPWKFVVVTDPAFRETLVQKARSLAEGFAEGLKAKFPERYQTIRQRFESLPDPVFYGAPAIFFIVTKGGDFADTSAGLAAENVMLAAKSLGIGSCWIGMAVGLNEDPEVRTRMKLADGEKISAPIILGYPLESPEPAPRASEVLWI